jgi:hypothetical protein
VKASLREIALQISVTSAPDLAFSPHRRRPLLARYLGQSRLFLESV